MYIYIYMYISSSGGFTHGHSCPRCHWSVHSTSLLGKATGGGPVSRVSRDGWCRGASKSLAPAAQLGHGIYEIM